MGLLLRIITKPKWLKPDWMDPEEVPADALTDLRSSQNELSVWSVERDKSNLDTVLVAVGSNRERLDKLDYALFDEDILPAIQIKCTKSEGETPHVIANKVMHRDLVELTAQKVAHLARALMPPTEHVRVSERSLQRLLQNALRDGSLDRSRVVDSMLAELEH